MLCEVFIKLQLCTGSVELWLLTSLSAKTRESLRDTKERPKPEKIKYIQFRKGCTLQALWKALFPLRSLQSFYWCTAPRKSMFRWVFCSLICCYHKFNKVLILCEVLWLQQGSWTKLIDLNFCFALLWYPTSSSYSLVFLSVKWCRY